MTRRVPRLMIALLATVVVIAGALAGWLITRQHNQDMLAGGRPLRVGHRSCDRPRTEPASCGRAGHGGAVPQTRGFGGALPRTRMPPEPHT
jgi:hypothetical protein